MKKYRRLIIAILIVAAAVTVYISYNIRKEKDNLAKSTPQTEVNDDQKTGELKEQTTGNQEEEKTAEAVSDKKKKENIMARAVYINAYAAGVKENIAHIINLSKTTEINSVVIDIKENGKVGYESMIPQVRDIGAYEKLYPVDEIVKTLHENGIYVIGRLVCFKDPVLSGKRPDLAIKRTDGQVWKENSTTSWTNPYMEEVWNYNIAIGIEAAEKGFDEIQFDYVRFPTVSKSEVNYGNVSISKTEAIGSFLKSAYKVLGEEKGVTVSADIFGIVCESPGDTEDIGQELEKVGRDIDYICPMVYPSHYANAAVSGYNANGVGQMVNGIIFTAPDLDPYGVVYNTLVKTRDRLSKIENYRAKVRPYLQDFTAKYLPKGYFQTYGEEQLRQQIKAVTDAGYDEWILWDPESTYSESGLSAKNTK